MDLNIAMGVMVLVITAASWSAVAISNYMLGRRAAFVTYSVACALVFGLGVILASPIEARSAVFATIGILQRTGVFCAALAVLCVPIYFMPTRRAR